MSKNICPNCGINLDSKITRKTPCPYCHMNIYIRSGEMVTEDEALTIDWLVYLENLVYLEDFIIDKNYFENERNKLSKRFGMRASVYDTVWKILNFLLIRFATDNSKQTQIHRLMANLLADENRDPTEHLIKSAKFENIANFKTRKEMLESEKRLAEIFPDEYDSESIEKQIKNLKFHELNEENLYESKPLFLGQPQFKYIRRLVKQGKIEDAEELLYKSYPSAAVLEELRKITGKKAWLAKADNDWDSVVKYLEGYTNYANRFRDHLSYEDNMPVHTNRETKLLQQAKEKLGDKK